MADRRTPSNWPYRAAKPVKRARVIKTADGSGVQRPSENAATFRVTQKQARLGLLSVFVAMTVAAAWWGYHSPYLTVHDVEVVGAQRLTAEQVEAAADINGESTLTVDIPAAEQRVAALPGVRSASIEKEGWSGATITIDERTPWGAWQVGDVRVPVDIDGYVLDGLSVPENAPVIVAANPQGSITADTRLDAGAIAVANRLLSESERTLGLNVQSLIYRDDAGLTAVLTGAPLGDRKLWVTFGDVRDYDYKVAALYVLLQQTRESDLLVTAVDLRFGDRLSFN